LVMVLSAPIIRSIAGSNLFPRAKPRRGYSHSIVAGGLLEMS
jgi:hypothetical protein